jgi:hypothetical protein
MDRPIDWAVFVDYLLNEVLQNSSSILKIPVPEIRARKIQKDFFEYQECDQKPDVRSFLRLLRRTNKMFYRQALGNISSSS